jgi:hypothetical protein
MNRRTFAKSLAIAGPALLMGCKPKPGQPPVPVIDQIIAGLKTADSVAQQLVPIIVAVNPEVARIAQKVDADIQLVIKVYTEYDTAAGETPANADLLRATVGAIQANLSDILSAIGVKNPELLLYVRVGVAIVNTALLAVLSRLPAPAAGSVSRAHAQQVAELPVVSGDLKATWNQAVEKAYPNSVIK